MQVQHACIDRSDFRLRHCYQIDRPDSEGVVLPLDIGVINPDAAEPAQIHDGAVYERNRNDFPDLDHYLAALVLKIQADSTEAYSEDCRTN